MRQRFRPEERALIIIGAIVEVHYASGNWIAARVTSEPRKSPYGGWEADATITGKATRVIGPGNPFRISPGNIRPVGSDWRVS